MLALLCLAIMIVLGDAICRRFYRFVNWPQRLATSFLVGILVSSPFIYLVALAFARTTRPLLWANVSYLIVAIPVIYWVTGRAPISFTNGKPTRLTKWDLAFLGGFFLFACWLMFATLSFREGKFFLAFKGWSDFGANISLLQSFALANNFPTTHPFFPSEPIRYHFVFWFQSANLSYLGLNPVWSVNLLSILALLSLLVLVVNFAELLFESKVIGRLTAILFLFSSSLYYLPIVRSQSFHSLMRRTEFLPSGYPWRGEDWGVMTISVLGYQRHLIGGMGILLVVLIFLIDRFRTREKELSVEQKTAADAEHSKAQLSNEVGSASSDPGMIRRPQIDRSFLYASIFSGVLIALLPFWNSPAFVSSIAILGCIFLFLPFRLYVGSLIFTALALGLPQVLMLRTRGLGQSLFHWGYTLENPTIFQVLKYLGWTFGFKWLLIGVALLFLQSWHRRLFLAFSSLIAVVFLFNLSVDNFNNHKLLNIWTIFASAYAAFGLWKVAKIRLVGIPLSIMLGVLTTFGGVIDLFPIHNDAMLAVAHKNDRLTTWVLANTKTTDLFLSQRWLSHQILFAGRKLFLGNTLFAWSAGYDVGPREAIYRRMFEERDPGKLTELLNANKIAYVAIDNGVRNSDLIQRLNEEIYERTFEKVFVDDGKEYDDLAIFKVSALKGASLKVQNQDDIKVSAFVGGSGAGIGQFLGPRGIAIDHKGNFYVADSGNSRVVKFSSAGEYLALVGEGGEFREPNGVAIDSDDNIYVTDARTHRLLKFRSDGTFEQKWSGPSPGFFGPRGLAIGSKGEIYVVDQGRARIVKLNADGTMSEWGSRGNGDGQFLEPTAVAIYADHAYVADTQNGRIQVFDTNGKFVNKWDVPEWQKNIWQYPELIVDQTKGQLYATSTTTNEVIVFSLTGQRLTSFKPKPPDELNGPSGLSLGSDRTLYVVNFKSERISRIPLNNQSGSR